MSEGLENLPETLEEQLQTCQELRKKNYQRSAVRIAREVQRVAKSNRQLIPYLHANFYLITMLQDLYELQEGQNIAIQSIALLESTERARTFQSDYDEESYEWITWWMSSCAYDNLATLMGMMHGFNSEGMHQCIADGIQVCRRTGKVECISCFREYATRVHRASDDIEMALHYTRTNMSQPPKKDKDHRWISAYDLTELYLLQGKIDLALKTFEEAEQLAQLYVFPEKAHHNNHLLLEEIALLSASPLAPPLTPHLAPPPQGENLTSEYHKALNEALRETCEGKIPQAIEKLTYWDRFFTQRNCLDSWFEVRLRLISAFLLNQQEEKALLLADQLETKAKVARDWLTLRRLNLLRHRPFPLSPLALLGPLEKGSPPPTPPTPSQTESSFILKENQEEEKEESPLELQGKTLLTELQQLEEDPAPPAPLAWEQIVEEKILSLSPKGFTSEKEARPFFKALLFRSSSLPSTALDQKIWDWTSEVVLLFSESAFLVNLQAILGEIFLEKENSPLQDRLSLERLESLYRKSLELDPHSPEFFSNTALFYLKQEKFNEAEHCLSRAFRLNRKNPRTALQLAQIYQESERNTDALAVLDMCIREGGSSPALFWEASMLAIALKRYQIVLVYLERYLSLLKTPESWVHFYRAFAFVELKEPEKALEALALEAVISPETLFAQNSIAVKAKTQQKESEEVQKLLENALNYDLKTIEYLTKPGLYRAIHRFYEASTSFPQDDPLRKQWEKRLLALGMASEDFFHTAYRSHEDSIKMSVNYYVCTLLQNLDEHWPNSPSCLAGQEKWKAFKIQYGVLATDENTARTSVFFWHQQIWPHGTEVLEILCKETDFTDVPGVLWQSYLLPPEKSEEF
jgi:hypothetical protein